VWESKAILFLTDVVLPIRQVRPQKLPRGEAGVRKRKMAAARQAARRCRLRQAQRDAGAPAEEEKEKGKEGTATDEEEVEEVEASDDDDLVKVADPLFL
jgi:hypothetical protein